MTDLQKHQEWLTQELAYFDKKISEAKSDHRKVELLSSRVAYQRAYNNTLKIQMNYGCPKKS